MPRGLPAKCSEADPPQHEANACTQHPSDVSEICENRPPQTQRHQTISNVQSARHFDRVNASHCPRTISMLQQGGEFNIFLLFSRSACGQHASKRSVRSTARQDPCFDDNCENAMLRWRSLRGHNHRSLDVEDQPNLFPVQRRGASFGLGEKKDIISETNVQKPSKAVTQIETSRPFQISP